GELWAVGATAIGSPNPHAYTAHLCSVMVGEDGFSPASSAASQGGTTDWTFDVANTQQHEIAERSLGLFDSGLRDPGTSFAFTFASAGSYMVQDLVDSSLSKVQVPTLAVPKSGGTDTHFTITWSASSPQPGFVFDVQIR